jgi:hypothetical protein
MSLQSNKQTPIQHDWASSGRSRCLTLQGLRYPRLSRRGHLVYKHITPDKARSTAHQYAYAVVVEELRMS